MAELKKTKQTNEKENPPPKNKTTQTVVKCKEVEKVSGALQLDMRYKLPQSTRGGL